MTGTRAELYSADSGENCLSVDTAATQDIQRPKFGSWFQRPSIEADRQRYANALPSLVCIAANTISLDLGWAWHRKAAVRRDEVLPDIERVAQ